MMKKIPKEQTIDSIRQKNIRDRQVDFSLAKFTLKYKNSSTCFSKHGRTNNFISSSYKLYFENNRHNDFFDVSYFDSVRERRRRKLKAKKIALPRYDLYFEIKERYSDFHTYCKDLLAGSVQGVSMVRMWNLSIVSSIIFGMFLMTMMYRYLGQGAGATGGVVLGDMTSNAAVQMSDSPVDNKTVASPDTVQPTDNAKLNVPEKQTGLTEVDKEISKEESIRKAREQKIREMVKGHPIESMVSEIAKKDEKVAAFLVAIARKESNWGKRSPVLDGKDCHNYWGFRAKRERMGSGEHTCFDSPKDAVDSVSKRISQLVNEEKIDTPERMVVAWKCGYDCSWDNPKDVKKWVSDVNVYFKELSKAK